MANYNNERQIIKFANSNSLVDAIDNMDTIHQSKGTFNKKILINVNNFKGTGHKEKYASFFWDYEDALLIADDIITGRFKTINYVKNNPAFYSVYGGGQFSRILNIGFKDDKYVISVALYKPIKTKTGAILPDKNNPIDNHSIQLSEYEMRRFMKTIEAHINSKLVGMNNKSFVGTTSKKEAIVDENNTQLTTEQQEEFNNRFEAASNESTSEIDTIENFLNGLDI